MNLKALWIFIIIFSMSIFIIMAFYAGKASTNIASIDNLATSLDDLQLDVQHLEQELAKKTGIEVRAKNRQAPKADQAFAKAEALLKQGDLANAGLYFSNGISQEPGNWAKINRYQQSVLDYCRQRIDNGDYEMALNVLGDMNTFMRTQALYVPVQDIEKLQQALTDSAQLKQSIVDKINQASQIETTQFVKTLLSQGDELLAQNSAAADNPDKITPHVEALKENLFALQSLDVNVVKQKESSQIAQQITQLENTIASLEQQLATAQAANTISILAQQATQFIDNAKKEPAQSDFVLYYLTSAESIIRQLVLVAPNLEMAKTQIATLSEQLDQAKQEIAKRQSERVWHEIEQAFEPIKQFDKQIKAQQAIEQLLQFRQLLAEKASKLSSIEVLEKAQAMMKEINNAIADWRSAQTRAYEKWAINKITTFYNRYQDELGAGTDEDRVYSGIIQFLGKIDMRYLSTPAQTAYNEAFQKFYGELHDEQKIPISSEMTLMGKKPLSDF
ncbi:MAG: hypothetical protein VSS75_030005 [Candidatus Parabeggiatoa sp.]|nr:hypothetical protein [Candidatus Parabeggiatoa sp.]